LRNIKVYVNSNSSVKFDQLPIKRDWMEATFDRHAYNCFPMSLANRLGWTFSYPEDIVFIWDGINDSSDFHVKILKGNKYAHPNRGNRTISFNTGITFDPKENITLLTMPVPNQFIAGTQCITTLITNSVLATEIPVAWMITLPNVEITIPAHTPIAAILPISLEQLQTHEVTVINGSPEYPDNYDQYLFERGEIAKEMNKNGIWTNFYRDAVDHLGHSVGNHETKKIILRVNYEKNN
jgi:hypothetical protein